jgi:UDP-N-acetylglucosamine transferase subunit ALG13
MGFVRFLDKADFDQRVRCADFIVAHGGIGIISDVLKLRKPLLVLPRIARLGEHVNDHQVKTAQFYGENGYVLVARESDDFAEVFRRLQSFTPRRRTAQPGRVADRIGRFLRHFDEP